MRENFESWSNGNGELVLYTENIEVSRVLRKIYPDVTTYERNGKVFAWQFLVPKIKLKFLERQISEKLAIENKELPTPP